MRERWGCKEVMRRSGLTRAQVRYAEERHHLGIVERGPDGRRRYTGAQLRWLVRLGCLRELGVALDDAAGIASVLNGGAVPWSPRRVHALLVRTVREIQRRVDLAQDLSALLWSDLPSESSAMRRLVSEPKSIVPAGELEK